MVKRKEYDILKDLYNKVVQDGKGMPVFVSGEAGIGKSFLINNFVRESAKSEKSNAYYKIVSAVSECTDNRIDKLVWKKMFIDLEYSIAALSDKNIRDDQSKIDYKNIMKHVYDSAGENWLKLIPIAGTYISDVAKIIKSVKKEADALKKAEEKMKLNNLVLTNPQEISYYIIKQFRELAGENVLVLFIKDIHWLDDSSLELFNYIIQDLYDRPYRLIFIVSYQEENLNVLQKSIISGLMEEHPVKKVLNTFRNNKSFFEMPLDRFDETQVKEFFNLRYPGNEFTKEFINETKHITNGNAYFLEEISNNFVETQKIYKENGVYKNKPDINFSILPNTIEKVILSRYRSLQEDEELQTLLEYASVMGEDFSAEIITDILGSKAHAVQRKLDRLKMDFGIIVNANISYGDLKKIYKFNHNLFQKCIYNKVTNDGNSIDYHRQTSESLRKLCKGNNIYKVAEQYAFHVGIGNQILDSEGNIILDSGSLEDEDYKSIADEYLDLTKYLVDKYEKSFGHVEAINRCNIVLGLAAKFENKELEIDFMQKKGNILKFIGDWDKAEQEFINSVNLSNEINDRSRISKAKLSTGYIYQLRGKYSEALKNLNESLSIFEEINDKDGMAGSLNSIGNILKFEDKYDEAKSKYEKAVLLFRASGNKRSEAIARMNIGNIHFDQSEYEDSKISYDEALNIFITLELRNDIAAVKKNIGNIHYKKNEYGDANRLYDEAMNEYNTTGHVQGIAGTYINKGVLHYDAEDYDNSHINYSAGLKIYETLGDKKGSALCYRNLGLIYLRKKELDLAMEYSVRAKSLNEELGNRKEAALCELNIGKIYAETNKYDEAIVCFDNAIRTGRELQIKHELCLFLFNKANVLYKSGKSNEAEVYNNEAIDIAEKIGAQKILFDCRILTSQIFALVDKKKSEEILNKMLINYQEELQQTEIKNEIHKLNN